MRRIAAIAATVFLVAGGAHAQVLGTLQGYVTDEQGGVLPGVSVTVSNTETGAERVIVTDSIGFYTAPSIPSGVYVITASLAGMQSAQRENIRLFVAQVLNVDFNLRVGSVTEELTVTSESPIVEVSSNATSHYVTQEEISELPIRDRNYVDFALLAPTVKREPIRGGLSMSGQKGISSGLNIDGMPPMPRRRPAPRSPDASVQSWPPGQPAPTVKSQKGRRRRYLKAGDCGPACATNYP